MENYKIQSGYLPNSIEDTIESLNLVREEMKNLKEREDSLKTMIYDAYKEKLEKAYKEKDEPFGVVNIKEDNFKISFTTPKKVKWDQDGLKKLYADGAPIEVEFNVKESVFKSQDDAGKAAFIPYRTVEPGSVSIKVEYND